MFRRRSLFELPPWSSRRRSVRYDMNVYSLGYIQTHVARWRLHHGPRTSCIPTPGSTLGWWYHYRYERCRRLADSLKMLCRYKDCQWRKYKFYVVDVDEPAILGLRACEQMHVVTINAIKSSANCSVPAGTAQKTTVTSIDDLKKQFPDQFDRIGSFEGKNSLFLKRDARPSIDAPRKCSIHLKARLQQELDTMENDGIIRKIEHHTDWCSSITTSVKTDGSLRVCLDPKRLNDNLKRCPHKIPTLEELNPEFAEARVFSKMDAKAGYWSIHLDEASQEITTFRTPFGRYCYRRLPFGLCVSQDLFQQAIIIIIIIWVLI